jgi:hypothetical protein
MRPAPGPIPSTLPEVNKVLRNLVSVTDHRRTRLMDYSISELVNTFTDGSPVWLTGSSVWLPAVFDTVEYNTDYDLVFANKDNAQRFIESVLKTLQDAHLKGVDPLTASYHLTRNDHGKARIHHPDGEHLIDAWHLDGDETIEELLMSYPNDYHRAAFFMSWGAPTAAHLTRIVKLRQRHNSPNMQATPLANLFRDIQPARTGY